MFHLLYAFIPTINGKKPVWIIVQKRFSAQPFCIGLHKTMYADLYCSFCVSLISAGMCSILLWNSEREKGHMMWPFSVGGCSTVKEVLRLWTVGSSSMYKALHSTYLEKGERIPTQMNMKREPLYRILRSARMPPLASGTEWGATTTTWQRGWWEWLSMHHSPQLALTVPLLLGYKKQIVTWFSHRSTMCNWRQTAHLSCTPVQKISVARPA